MLCVFAKKEIKIFCEIKEFLIELFELFKYKFVNAMFISGFNKISVLFFDSADVVIKKILL